MTTIALLNALIIVRMDVKMAVAQHVKEVAPTIVREHAKGIAAKAVLGHAKMCVCGLVEVNAVGLLGCDIF